jgi:hypothetical protein
MTIQCPKHGRVEGPICRECRAEEYVTKVKNGLRDQVELKEYERSESDILPLQIRFRAYLIRMNKESLNSRRWKKRRSTGIRFIPLGKLENLL